MDYDGVVSDASEDIFSDDDGTFDARLTSPDPKANSSFLNLSQTPVLLFHRQREETPGKAIVPRTPLTLAPFISKADNWTSDMETPVGKRDQIAKRCKSPLPDSNEFDDVTQTAEPILTPPHLKIPDDANDEIVPLSQEIPPRKKQKRPPKRRIFDKTITNCSTLYEDDETDDETESDNIKKSQFLTEHVDPQFKTSLKKLEELRELQRKSREKRGFETLSEETIPDDEFLKSCRALEMCDRAPRREQNTQPTPCTLSLISSSEEPVFSPIWDDPETPVREEEIQETIPLTPASILEIPREDNFSQIDLGIDDIEQEDDMFLEKTFIMEDEELKIKRESIKIEEPDMEDDFRGFSKEEQESKELWEFQRIFVLKYGGLSPKKFNFPGFSFVETEIAKTIYQNNEIFLNNYLEKYYGIRKQVDPPMITLEDTESEESQPNEDIIPQLHHLPPLLVSVYSGFDTAGGSKLFLSVDKIIKEQTKLQKDEPTEMHSIDVLISSINTQDLTKVQTSIRNKMNDVQILEVRSIEPIKYSDQSKDKITSENIENKIINRNTSSITNLSRDKCDKIITPVPSPLNTVESVPNVAELPDNFPDCVGYQTLGKPDKIPEKVLSRVSDLCPENTSKNYTDCLNEISNLKRKSRSLRLNRVQSAAIKPLVSTPSSPAQESLPMPKATPNQSSNENCDPERELPLSRTFSPLSPLVPDQNDDDDDDDDQLPMNFGVPRWADPGQIESRCRNTAITPPSVDNNDFPQLRNTNCLPMIVNPNPNEQFPGFVTGTGKSAHISEKAWSMGRAMFAQAGKEAEVDVQKPSSPVDPIGSTFKKLNPLGKAKPFVPLNVQRPELRCIASTSESPTGLITSTDRSFETREGVIMSKLLTSLNVQRSEPRSTSSTFKPTMGFTTGNGGSINLSEAAQEKIKSAMEEFFADLDEQDANLLELSRMKKKSGSSRNKHTTDNNPAIEMKTASASNIQKSSLTLVPKPFIPLNMMKPMRQSASSTSGPTLGFTTAGGGAIKLSEATLDQIKAGLDAYTPDVDEMDPNFSDLSSLKNKVLASRHKKSSDLSDTISTTLKTPTARSELPLKRTSLPFMSKQFTPLNVKRPDPRPHSTPKTFKSTVGFTTGSGGSIKLSEVVQEKIKAGLEAYTANVDDSEQLFQELSDMKNKITKKFCRNSSDAPDSAKRKNSSDDVTPFGRKRARTATDLQARVLFSEINEEDEEIIQSSLMFDNNQGTENDRNLPFKNVVSEEVRASTTAFLDDLEKHSNRPASRWSDSSCLASSSAHPTERRTYSFPSNNSNEKAKIIDKKLPPTNAELIPDDIVFDSQEFLESYEKISTKIKLNEAVERKKNEAISKQENLIQMKRINRERKNPGSLLQIKEQDRAQLISLRQLCLPGTSPAPRNIREFPVRKIDPAVSSINSSTAEYYQFNLEEFYRNVNRNCVEGITVGDGALLIPNEHNLAGVLEFKRSFLASPGVDPTLVPENWVENHYKWIVWKLGSMDRVKFTRIPPPKYLTPDRVLKQLKYRYDREIDRAERPVLRRIMEKDDAPARRMILCVSRLKKITINNETNFSMELTDGWYSVIATLDSPMINNIYAGKIKEGVKLLIYGAQLMNAEDGCHPLEAPDHVRLKIHTNSTRRVKWYTKLGLQKYGGPMELSLSHIHPSGGLIGKVSAVVSRLYPIIYKETTADGQVIFRNAKSEEHAQMSFTKNYESQCASSSRLTRHVTPCLKIRITDGNANGIVTIWQNAEECSEMFKEGNAISIIHGIATGKRSNELQINATRWTTFDVRTCRKKFTFPERIFTPLSDPMTQCFTPNYGEFDTIGIVVSIGPAPHGMKNFETVNLAFRNAQGEDSFLSILFWEGVVSYGYSDIATIGSIICCINCEWRRNTYRSIPTAFCTERTIITRNPRQSSHLRNEFDSLRYRIGDTSNYVDNCATRIHNEVMKKSITTAISFSPTPGRMSSHTTADLTPKNRRTAAIKCRLDKLQDLAAPMPKLSPINLAGSSRVSLDFKPPLSRPPRLSPRGWKT